jgi:nucleoside-diphosphate-sugar epimerase
VAITGAAGRIGSVVRAGLRDEVDSLQVLETLPDGRTPRLNRALLRDRFELR